VILLRNDGWKGRGRERSVLRRIGVHFQGKLDGKRTPTSPPDPERSNASWESNLVEVLGRVQNATAAPVQDYKE
jgi:hypothetical protein